MTPCEPEDHHDRLAVRRRLDRDLGERLDLGGGNIAMGYTLFTSILIGTVASATYTPFTSVCTGSGFVISATCYTASNYSAACPWKVNASGQLAGYNCTASTLAVYCSGICANMR